MFRSVPMVHVMAQVPGRDAARATRAIAAAGLLHLVDIAHGRIAADAAPPGTRELLAAFRDLARRVRTAAERLGVPLPELSGGLAGPPIEDFEDERRAIEALLGPLEAAVETAAREAAQAHERAAHAAQALERAGRLREADVPLSRLLALRFAAVRLGTATADDLDALAAVIAPAPFAIVPLATEQDRVLAAVAVPASGKERLEGALRVAAFETTALPARAEGWDEAALLAERDEAERKEARARADLVDRRPAGQALLVSLYRRVQAGVLLLQAQTLFAASGRFVVISGWIPAEGAARLRASILEATGGRAVVETERPEDLPQASADALRVPILHRNPLLLRPFQKLVQLYGTPSYREVEPTAFFALSFLVMFGMMFGDLGHGLVLFAAGYCLFRYVPRYLDYGILLMEGGASSAAFGVLYGSFFGIEGLLPVVWMEPLRELPRFMGLAAALGVVLVSAGLLLGVLNTWRSGQRARALFGPRGLFGAFVYWVTLALLARAFVPATLVVPTGALVALLAVPALLLLAKPVVVRALEGPRPARPAGPAAPRWLVALEGSVELVDAAFSYFANTLSFLRVAAFAAVHAGVFVALFALADTLARVSFGGGALSVVSLVAGNALVILLEGLTVSVQVLRLEYYEFFSKFFRGGGEPYRPLMLSAAGKEPDDGTRAQADPGAGRDGPRPGAARPDGGPGADDRPGGLAA
jgi:V/A-type H+-transporting ATPase subunit I